MSDKPKIYSYCEAGCKWESVHKSDHDALASAHSATSGKVNSLIAGTTPIPRTANADYATIAGKAVKLVGGLQGGWGNWSAELDVSTGIASTPFDEAKPLGTYVIVVDTAFLEGGDEPPYKSDRQYTFTITLPEEKYGSTATSNMCPFELGTDNNAYYRDKYCYLTFSWSDKRLYFNVSSMPAIASDYSVIFFLGYKLLSEESEGVSYTVSGSYSLSVNDYPTWTSQKINGTWGGQTFDEMRYSNDSDHYLTFYKDSASLGYIPLASDYADGQVINFGSESQEVDEEFYSWLTANATKQ